MVDVNPKQAEGDRKVSMAAVPCGPLFKLGQVMQYGADKYGRHNFRTSGAILASTYYDAALRHLAAWWEGQALDPESRLEHLAHVMACMVVLLDAMDAGSFVDNRPPAASPSWLNDLNRETADYVANRD